MSTPTQKKTGTQVKAANQNNETPINLTVRDTQSTPAETWDTLLRFSGPLHAEQEAMRATVDTLFKRGYELVVATYDHLKRFPETAEILGWQDGTDEVHIAERRRFFAIWLARTLSMDFGTQFGDYLFYAGKVHAGHGSRHIETPSMWITGSVGLIIGVFADFIREAQHPTDETALALSGWNKYLLIQLNQMQVGYDVGKQLLDGEHSIEIKAYAMVRHNWGRETLTVHFRQGHTVADVLRKTLDFSPKLREVMFDIGWEEVEQDQDLWMRVRKVYHLREGWRVQLNGKNLAFNGGFNQAIQPDDQITLFSPGR